MKRQILLLALMFIATLGIAQTDIRRAEGLTDQDWKRLNNRPDYAKELIAVQDSLLAGQTISVSHLQDLMPRNYNDFRIFVSMEYYAVTTAESGDLQLEDDKGIWSVAADYATVDSFDMMKYYLMWFEWCDGWIADDVWTRAVEIERQHPQKFKELMASSKWFEAWQDYRDEYIEWKTKSKQ